MDTSDRSTEEYLDRYEGHLLRDIKYDQVR